jgi:hypothetical protein
MMFSPSAATNGRVDLLEKLLASSRRIQFRDSLIGPGSKESGVR